MDEIPIAVLEELIKNAEQLSPEVIAALLASKDLPPAIREKLMKEINSNKKLKEKLKSKKFILFIIYKHRSNFSTRSISKRRGRCRKNCTESKTGSEKTKSGS
jgi:hypothetical protein